MDTPVSNASSSTTTSAGMPSVSSSSGGGPLVTGLFPDRQSAEAAYASAHERGYSKDDVNLVMSDETRKRHFSAQNGVQTELGNKAAEGAGIGGAIGGTVGALLTGVFAQKSLNGIADGLLFGNPGQLRIQVVAVLAAIVYSGVVSFILLKLVGLVFPLRASLDDESEGMDMSMHGEEAYVHSSGNA